MNVPCPSFIRRFASASVFIFATCATALAQAPTITGFAPNPIGIGMPITITGTNFSGNGNVTVRFANVTATSTVINSPTQVTATVPQTLNPGAITVTTSLGGIATSEPYDITLVPVITGINPSSGPEKRLITVSGFNFLGTGISNRIVRLNGMLVPNTSASSTAITFPIPAGAMSGPITVQTSAGFATSSGNVTVESGPPPANDHFANATPIAGTSGSITGNNANATSEPGEPTHTGNAGGVSVWFKWTAPTSGMFLFNPTDNQHFGIVQSIYTGADLSSLTLVANGLPPTNMFARYTSAAVLNATAGTTYYIALDGYTGLMANYRLAWSPLNPPTISSFTSTAYVGQQVNISGTNFPPGAIVTIGGTLIPQSRITYSSATSISIPQLPANVTSGPVMIATPAGSITSTINLTVVTAPPPVIASFNPASGPSGSSVTITGNAIYLGPDMPPSTVRFNGIASTSVVGQNSSTLVAIVPAGATTGPLSIETLSGIATSSTSFVATTPVPPPTIAGFSPASGQPGTIVTINGQNFFNLTSIQFNGIAAAFTVNSPTQITATVPPGATSGPITVTNPGGTTASGTTFIVPPPPTITSFSPTNLTFRMRVVITGTGFAETQSVQFNGVATNFTIDSDTQITSALPPFVSSGPIAVTTPYGTAVSSTHYTVMPPAVPTIASFSPAEVSAGMPVIIDGTGFSGVVDVRFNNASVNFTVLSPTQIETRAPLSGLTAGHITVTTTLGSTSSPTPYTVTLTPIITGIVPSTGSVGRIITVQGSNFSGPGITTATVRVNGTPIGVAVRSSTAIAFAVPAGATTGPITVETAHGIAVSPSPFIVASGPAPANDHFANAIALPGPSGSFDGNLANATKEPGEPNHADNPGGASVWFSWTAPSSGLFLFNPNNFSTAQFGVIQSIYTGNSINTLTRVASGLTPTNVLARYGSAAVLDAVAGTTYHIALDGYNGVMPDFRLTWSPFGPPTIFSFNPASGLPGQTTPTISISGSNFAPGSVVTFNGTPVTPARLTFDSPNSLRVTQIPAGATTGPIAITTPAGTAVSAGTFVIGSPTPTIAGFSPSGAKVETPVMISGTNFGGTTAVLFNGTATSNFTVTGNNTLINTSVPVGATTGPITVVTPLGQAVSAQPFVVVVLPVITEQPQSQTVPAFSNVVFSVTASSNGPEEYQWRKNGGPIFGNPSADTRTLMLNNVTAADAGSYTCFVINNAGGVTSEPATLTVTKAAATVTLANLGATYDGTPKSASATTAPAGLSVQLTYDGSATAPTNAGSYTVDAIVTDPNYSGSATGTLTIAPASATVQLANLAQRYDGTSRVVTAVTTPADLPVTLAYSGSPAAPTYPGSYAVVATLADPNYTGTVTGTLVVSITALIRHAPTLNGDLDGSIQVLQPESVTLNGKALVAGDLLVPGTPTVRLNGQPTYGSTLDATGAPDPASHLITLNGQVFLRHVVRRIDAIALPIINAPASPAGTRTVVLNSASQSVGDFATLLDLTLNANVGDVTVPPGAYGSFTLNQNSGLILGIADSTTPAIYDLQRLTLNGGSHVRLVGPVVLTLGNQLNMNGVMNTTAPTNWLTLKIVNGGLTLNSNAALAGDVLAPDGTVTLNSATLTGSVTADRLIINSNAVLQDPVE